MVSITTSPIDIAATVAFVTTARADGVDVFVHTVRSHSHGKRVSAIEFTTDLAQAREILSAIERTLRTRWPLENVALIQRIGVISVGQAVYAAAVSSTSKRHALEACHYAIESIRSTIPVKTRERFEEGLAWYVGQHDVDVCGLVT
jgi:molybdopterin synthase catalytic subunit